jgi:hypothetical protein
MSAIKSARAIACYLLLTAAFSWASVAQAASANANSAIAVTTYHYNELRTGWNNEETLLSASAFPPSFGVMTTVSLDDQVDAQPLLVPGQIIAGSIHDLLYVVTENNSIYALDARSGHILVTRNLGAPVPTPLGCGNNGPNVGITSTPVVDLARHRIYVIAYINGAAPQYQLHALDLVTLADSVPAVTVTATQKLSDGSEFAFNATYQRQRPALLEHDGVIYAGFGSFCDFEANRSRGWVLGWRAGNLAPLAHAELNDTQATSSTNFFLSSVWMSGFGLAANSSTIFFSTGNSDCNFYDSPEDCPSQSTYDGVTNIQESVVGLQPNLGSRTGVFTPANVFQMDVDDADLGASGVMLLPTQSGTADLAAIVSKDGRLFLLDQNNLSTALDMQQLGSGCWCGASYYRGHDGIGRVVTSAGALQTWQISTSPAAHWVAETTTSTIPSSEQDPGFFTVVTSNARKAGSAIIWAVGRPTSTTGLTLYAFAATPTNGTLQLLYSSPAGQWPNLGGNANVVPMVANGLVYVGGYKTLMIFGPNGGASPGAQVVAVQDNVASGVRRITGTLLEAHGLQLILLTRSSDQVAVDASAAVAAGRSANLRVGEAYTVLAPEMTAAGNMRATSIMRAKPGQGAWPTDR